jgi:S-adenosylmethionine decarboxylase
VFEGPEKKLEVYFSRGSSETGFRQFQADVWSGVLADAACTILHHESNVQFDAYLLSESSLFVFANRVILKTCGTTTLLLVLPKLLALAEQLDCAFEHILYSRLRYKFPDQQIYPHDSFQHEQEYFIRILGHADARILGPPDGRCWYVLHASGPQQHISLVPCPLVAPVDGDDIFEMAMEGLSEEVCAHFFKLAHPKGISDCELASRMTVASGIGALLPGVLVDDWAFEPCGYSMNGLRGAFYFTVHITPESGFSYASFETNDPKYREPAWVEAIAATFKPSALTLTLTTREVGCELEAYKLAGFSRTNLETTHYQQKLAQRCDLFVCAINFARAEDSEKTMCAGHLGGKAGVDVGRWWA